MAFPRTFFRLTLDWVLAGGEVAQTSCSWDADSPIVSLDTDTVAALSGRANAFWTAVKGSYTAEVQYVGSRVAWVGTNGHTIMSAEAAVTASPGTASDHALPAEVAHVISLRTANAGRSYRGRMYLPPLALGVIVADGRVAPTTLTTLSTAAANLLGTLTVGSSTLSSVVASATAAVMSPIIEVATGDVPDVQRRRRDRLHEVYTVHAVS